MQFSILIPVYNTYIESLVTDLHQQASRLTNTFEIILIDDCSTLSISYINLKIKSLQNVTYKVLTENIGRAAIRNQLFEMANFENCIVLDNDMKIIKSDFILNYLSTIKEDEILCGGHQYPDTPPSPLHYLHWWYGTTVESKKQDKMMTGNFCCKKSTFEKLCFDESIRCYGHEDTLLDIQAKKQNIAVKFIDNPCLHLGIDTNDEFLLKQKTAVQNLKKIYEKSTIKNELKKEIRLISYAESSVYRLFATAISPWIRKKLKSNHPSIWALQMQKILWWNKENQT